MSAFDPKRTSTGGRESHRFTQKMKREALIPDTWNSGLPITS